MGDEMSDEKRSLELKKLGLEIAEMERPWWRRPAYILAALPTILAVVALSVGFVNGFFGAQLTKLENQRHDLEAQIKEFEAKRNELNRQYDETKKQLDEVNSELNKAKILSETSMKTGAEQLRRAVKCENELQKLKAQTK